MTTISSSQLTGRFDGRMPAWIFAAVSGTHCSASVELLATVFAFPLFPADCWFPMLESAFSFLHAHLHFATGTGGPSLCSKEQRGRYGHHENETIFLAERTREDQMLARNVAYKGREGRCLHATCAVLSWRQRCFARPDAFKAVVPYSHCAVDVSRTLCRPRAAPCLHLTQIKRAGGAQRTAFASKVARCL